MKALVLVLILFLGGCATAQKHWYEYPGIALGGATIGAVVGPEAIAVNEANKRGSIRYSEDAIFYSVLGFVCHAVTGIILSIHVPPAGWAYFGMSSFLGAAAFAENGGYDGDKTP